MPPHPPGLAESNSWNSSEQTAHHFTAKMTSFSTSAQCSASDSACRISPEQTNQVRPKLPLLKILQAAGAQGEMFTVKEVSWDSPSGPGVKTLASGAEGVGSVPGHILF